ncbi:hypothetical protein FRC18_006729 [Serendipita sp. 400]|nr:hypothetical protein FRC18_006729 [Serendipita sp. 400]
MEERDKTRDALARIDGLEKDKVLAVFKPSRLLINELPEPGSFADPAAKPPDLTSKSPPPVAMNTVRDKGVKQKSSFRRISEVLGSKDNKDGLGSKRDLWLVKFNDVILLCQRVGTTTLPLSATTTKRANSNPDGQGKPKYATGGKRASSQARPRNLYRFIKVQSWTINEKPKPRELVSKEAIERWRTQHTGGHLMASGEEDELEEEEAEDSDDSDRKSKMSFSYWGADKVTLTKPMARRGAPTNASRPQIRLKPTAPSSFAGRESAKESKFGTRLRSPEPSVDGSVISGVRPYSSNNRRTGFTASPQVPRRNITSTVDSKMTAGSTASLVSNRPGGPGAPTLAATGAPVKRIRNSSVTSGAPRIGNVKTLSAVPSEDSGVGMYRQIIAQDPSISSVKS